MTMREAERWSVNRGFVWVGLPILTFLLAAAAHGGAWVAR